MISNIFVGTDYIPPYGIFRFVSALALSAFSLWFGYRRGVRSQKEAAKLKAKIDVLAIVDRLAADIERLLDLFQLHSGTQDALSKAAFRFSCQMAECKRRKIEQALADYQALNIEHQWPPAKDSPGWPKFDAEYKAMTDGLKRLRDEISDT
jgi:hypothetical protein